ncbi:MAG TPA: sigma-70 family RNA polymerase sigma factor [Polyangiaceae bacterium]|nr:sigma-70 family RNA polymerase sigma factor [Polyangiaceae bacterium]
MRVRAANPLVVAAAEERILGSAEATGGLRDLFRGHAGYVWNTLRRLGVPPADLEDLTHDVFLRVHRHLAQYDPTRAVRPWLFGFAFRVASQYRRRAYRRHEVFGEPEAAAHAGTTPEEQMAAAEDRALVLEALQAIELGRRAVFVLYEIDGATMKDIGDSLGIPVNTAYSRLRVARTEFTDAVRKLRSGRGPR